MIPMLSPTPPFRLCCFVDCLQPRDKAAMLVVKTIKKLFRRICMIKKFSSERREIVLLLSPSMAAVTSVANQQLLQQENEGNATRVTLRGKCGNNMTRGI